MSMLSISPSSTMQPMTPADHQRLLFSLFPPNKVNLVSRVDDDDDFFHEQRLAEVSKARRPADYSMISPAKRTCCIDCLIDTADELGVPTETRHLAVNYFDRYLSSAPDDMEHLLLVGLTCLLLALIHDKHLIIFDRCAKSSIFSLEDHDEAADTIVRVLDYDLEGPTAWTFLGRYVRAGGGGLAGLERTAEYISEVSLLEYSCCVEYLPSLVAASTVFLARFLLDPSERPWNRGLQRCTGYGPPELRECVLKLQACRTWGFLKPQPPSTIPPLFFTDLTFD